MDEEVSACISNDFQFDNRITAVPWNSTVQYNQH